MQQESKEQGQKKMTNMHGWQRNAQIIRIRRRCSTCLLPTWRLPRFRLLQLHLFAILLLPCPRLHHLQSIRSRSRFISIRRAKDLPHESTEASFLVYIMLIIRVVVGEVIPTVVVVVAEVGGTPPQRIWRRRTGMNWRGPMTIPKWIQ